MPVIFASVKTDAAIRQYQAARFYGLHQRCGATKHKTTSFMTESIFCLYKRGDLTDFFGFQVFPINFWVQKKESGVRFDPRLSVIMPNKRKILRKAEFNGKLYTIELLFIGCCSAKSRDKILIPSYMIRPSRSICRICSFPEASR